MLPIAKAVVLLVLIGAGVTATYAITNGGFGNGAGSDDNTQKTAESTAASPKSEAGEGAPNGQENTDASSQTPEGAKGNGSDQQALAAQNAGQGAQESAG